jgi:hypothetical protein
MWYLIVRFYKSITSVKLSDIKPRLRVPRRETIIAMLGAALIVSWFLLGVLSGMSVLEYYLEIDEPEDIDDIDLPLWLGQAFPLYVITTCYAVYRMNKRDDIGL